MIALRTIALLAFTLAATEASLADSALILPTISRPAYRAGQGPVVLFDEAHFNYHVWEGSDQPFVEYLASDGYRVERLLSTVTPEILGSGDILVIALAIAERNKVTVEGDQDIFDWSRPHPSAFLESEALAIRNWVDDGGSLLLIADHPPFVGAVAEIGALFGVRFSDGFAREIRDGEVVREGLAFDRSNGSLADHDITNGRDITERVSEILTFGSSGFEITDAEPILILSESVVSIPDRNPASPHTSIGGWFQGAALQYGDGRAVFFGEAGMFFAALNSLNLCPEVTEEDPFVCRTQEGWHDVGGNLQLLLNVMHWLSG